MEINEKCQMRFVNAIIVIVLIQNSDLTIIFVHMEVACGHTSRPYRIE